MATRHQRAVAAPQPANRGAAVPAGKQKAAAAVGRPDARHRKALGDIGNLVNTQVIGGKIQLPEGINRPITRSFRSQLLQKAQADAAATNKNAIAALKPASKPEAALKPASKPEAALKPASKPEAALKPASKPEAALKPASKPEAALKPASKPEAALKPASKPEAALKPASKPEAGLKPASKPEAALKPASKPEAALKPASKPAKPVPRPEPVAKISPDEIKEPLENAGSCSAHRYSRKKVVNTLTTVLTARSKFACGLTEKPKELIEDIDKLDADNQLAVVDYIEDIYKFYKTAQHESRPTDYMATQLEINPNMRAILTNWIVEVHYKFELMPETLYLTMYVIDRYLSMQSVQRRELQLVGVAAMLIACKYEEIWAPEVNDFICISDNAYTRQQILAMEKSILNKLEWNLTVPTPYVFLVRFVKAAGSDKEMEHMVFFFAEMALKEYSMVSFCPSMVAASAVYASRCTLKKSPLWTDTLKHHTGFNEAQLLECAKILVNSHAAAPEGKLKAVYKKYSSEQLGRVALHPPAVVQGLV